MFGPGLAPSQPRRPSTSRLVVVRVFFVTVAVMSIGFLSWTATLCAALVTGKRSDWLAFCATAASSATGIGLLTTDPTDHIATWRGAVGMAVLISSGFFAAGWYLYADVRHYRLRRQAPAYGLGQTVPTYGSPHAPYRPAPGYGQGTVPSAGMPADAPRTPLNELPTQHAPTQYSPTRPVPPAPPVAPGTPPRATPAPARIDQVRAELDELSDYLRRHGSDQPTEDGR